MHHTYTHATQIIMVFVCLFFKSDTYCYFFFFLACPTSINLTFCYSNEKTFNIREISQEQSSNFRYLFFCLFLFLSLSIMYNEVLYVYHLILLIFVSLRKEILSVSITFPRVCVYNHTQEIFAIISCLWHQFYV